MDNTISLIGIAKKAGYLAIGEEPVGAAARAHKARLILLASDTAEASVRRAESFAQSGGIFTLPLTATKAELGGILGRTSCAMVAITDAGLAASIAKKITAKNPSMFAEQTADLERKAKRVNDRRREKRIHDRRVARSAEKPWVGKPKAGESGKKVHKPKRTSNVLVSDVMSPEKPSFTPAKTAPTKPAAKTKFRMKPKQS